jgi:SAM-dependent methyltransferase
MKKQEKDDIFASQLPGILHYHQLMLADGVRNKLLFEAIKRHVTGETSFLDIGAGTGVWAILAAKLGAKRVVAVEIEESLIPVLFRHAQENGVADKIEIIHGNVDDVKIRGKFDVIVSELFGSFAIGEQVVKSFVNLRNRFLAAGGVLIPQKMTLFAAPVYTERNVQNIPAELPISCDFLKSLKMNYSWDAQIADRQKLKFLVEPKELLSFDFRTVETAPSLKNLSQSWQLNDLSAANAVAVFNSSTFDDGIVMDNFNSQSWGTTIYEFQPFAAKAGEIKFDLMLDEKKSIWSVSLLSEPDAKPKNYSPAFAVTRLRMAQQMTPHRRFNAPKPKNKKSQKTKPRP